MTSTDKSAAVREVLEQCLRWHNGDKFRDDPDEANRDAWEAHKHLLENTLATLPPADLGAVAEWQYRSRPGWKNAMGWTEWQKCSAEAARDYIRTPSLHDWHYEVRALYAAPSVPSASLTTPSKEPAGAVAVSDEQIDLACERHSIALRAGMTSRKAMKRALESVLAAPGAAIAAREQAITKAEVLRVAQEIGLVGWISDCGDWFEFTETQQPSKLLIQFAEHYAAPASRPEAPPASAPAAQELAKLVLEGTKWPGSWANRDVSECCDCGVNCEDEHKPECSIHSDWARAERMKLLATQLIAASPQAVQAGGEGGNG